MLYLDMIFFLPLISIIGGGFCFLLKKERYILSMSLAVMTFIFVLSATAFVMLMKKDMVIYVFSKWISFVDIDVSWSLRMDRLSTLMLAIISSVALVVFFYSIDYIEKKEKGRFFWLLSLFIFFMILLVVADDFLQFFCGWEGVGVTSYLLIGFHQNRLSAANASMKAFIVNRIGDICFIVALAAIYITFKTFNFDLIFSEIPSKISNVYSLFGFQISSINTICFLLFLACMAKSAQIGFHVWLPDAMEGPTPVSALIHSATMVAAGVFLIIRCSFLFQNAILLNNLIIMIGSLTSLIFAISALVQSDIKRVIAYSTCSQLGYMFMGCGANDYGGAMFHLLNNASLKALLFLLAGVVIKSTGTQDINNMNGLPNKNKFIYTLFWIGVLSLIGVMPFATHTSKNHILFSVYEKTHGKVFFFIGSAGIFFTVLYSFRLMFNVFHNAGSNESSSVNIKNTGFFMKYFPLILVLMNLASLLMKKYGILDGVYFNGSVFVQKKELPTDLPYWIIHTPTLFVVSGILMSYFLWKRDVAIKSNIIQKISGLILRRNTDRLYKHIFVSKTKTLSVFFANIIDNKVIDFILSRLTVCVLRLSALIFDLLHIGKIEYYLLVMIAGFVLFVLCMV